MTRTIRKSGCPWIIAAILLAGLASGCAGEDYTPVYFPPPAADEDRAPTTSEAAGGRMCTLSFTSQLCVAIKGEDIDVGTDPNDSLCAEVPPFPMRVEGSTITIRGSEFPDLEISGHGLPVPIVINARGDGEGTSNVGEGTIDQAGNITIGNFSFFILALGIVGEVPDLTLTTGSTEELPHLPQARGSPPDAGGAMTLVTGTVLGSLIEAADKYLMGASLTATFAGSISPALSECGGEAEHLIEVTKLVIDEEGRQTESHIPGGNRMEVSAGTYIAEGPGDIGPRFEASAQFRVKNISTRPQAYQLPPRKGAFYLDSTVPLAGTLGAGQSFILKVTFRPAMADSEPGEIVEALSIGPNQFLMVGKALAQSGEASVDVVDEGGGITKPDVDDVEVGSSKIPVSTERSFFKCEKITCGEAQAWTRCSQCPDPTATPCELLAVSTSGRPMGEVDSQCRLVDPNAAALLTMDLKGPGRAEIAAQKQVLAIRNKGVDDLEIKGISIEEVAGSRSPGQFVIPGNAIFLAKSFDDVRERVAQALQGDGKQGTRLPAILAPFQPGFDETTLYVVVIYQPDDLLGADGEQAGVGSVARDRAIIRISTDGGEIETVVTGTTTILEAPPLELYFKTSTGTKHVLNNGSFSFSGVSASTVDVAVPLFLRTADAAGRPLRVTSIGIQGEGAQNFRWLDTAEKIAAVVPPTGKGMRCSVFDVDESTGEVVGESFDLNPVSLAPPGFDMAPGAYSIETMPLFGCVDFHRDEGEAPASRIFEAKLVISAQELDDIGMPVKNPDGSLRQTELSARLLAAIDPRSGKLVMRITQTAAAILNPQFPSFSAISARSEMVDAIASGQAKKTDLQVFTSAMILDPFDEMRITTSDGEKVLSAPNDGITGVFRVIDTHLVSVDYDDENLFDYASLLFDAGLAPGSRGIFEDYPNVPEGSKANGWRIFTASLSYPGPLAPPEKKPQYPSHCLTSVNPCDPKDLKKFTDAGAGPDGKGACAFFYASGGRFDSPAFHTADELPGGEYTNLCNRVGEPQALYDIDTGRYSVDGRIEFEEVGMRFFGPTYFHNPGGPLGSKPPLDQVFVMGFTTGVLAPQEDPDSPDILPDEKIDMAKNEFKINLNDPTLASPPLCENNTRNRVVDGKRYSTWKYMEGLLFKDREATIPAGCPEEDNDYTGGSAYLRGRDLDHETGTVTFVAAAKFGSSDDLSFAFKDVMLFLILNGWLCDPMGAEEDFEGSHCFDQEFTEHDATGQIPIMD